MTPVTGKELRGYIDNGDWEGVGRILKSAEENPATDAPPLLDKKTLERLVSRLEAESAALRTQPKPHNMKPSRRTTTGALIGALIFGAAGPPLSIGQWDELHPKRPPGTIMEGRQPQPATAKDYVIATVLFAILGGTLGGIIAGTDWKEDSKERSTLESRLRELQKQRDAARKPATPSAL